MKKLLVVIFVLAMVTMTWAGWNHAETVFEFSGVDSGLVGGTGSISGEWFESYSPHGVVVDANGRIWVAIHYGNGPDQSGSPEFVGYNHNDGIADDTCHFVPLYCFNADGSHASFSPITIFELPGGAMDTLYSESVDNGSGKGISQDNDGNILYSAYSTVYRFNYQTGACLGKWTPSVMGSITKAVQDPVTNLIYVGKVGGGNPIYLLDEDLGFVANAVDANNQINRTIAVKTDENGTDLYTGSTWNGHGIHHWFSEDAEFNQFEKVDTLGNLDELVTPDTTYTNVVLWVESLDITPDGKLLVGALRRTWAGPLCLWYIIDPETGEYVEEFGTEGPDPADDHNLQPPPFPGAVNGPRGGFFTDATTLYTADFYMNTVDKWTWTESSVDNETVVLDKFALKQNFPNPFNPTTVIPFVIEKDADVRLTVYDVLGNEVQTLVNSRVSRGSHQIRFDASNMATGVYIYRLETEGQTLSRKMMFMK